MLRDGPLIFMTALLAVTGVSPAASETLPPAQAELVSAERAFARLAAERGFRESFITWFADDGIGFNPHPHRVRDVLGRQPPDNTPMGLKWAPAFGDISQAGDLGWNTGPTLFESDDAKNKPPRHGMFFSVWKKQSDGSWRVVLDLGADTPDPVVALEAPFTTSYRRVDNPAAQVNVEAEIAALLERERTFLSEAGTAGAGKAYLTRLSDDARVHRPGMMPAVGKAALSAWLDRQTASLSGGPIRADVSRSGDLGYVYGHYTSSGAPLKKGYYARVWKRDATGAWRIVMDTVSPLPAGADFPPAILAPSPLAEKADAHYQAGQWAEAAAAYQQLAEKHHDIATIWHRLGSSQVHLRRLPEAIQSLERSISLSGGAALDFYNLACAFALSGDREKAIDNVEKAIRAGFNSRPPYETDSDLDSLRQSERFKALLKQLP